MLGVILFNCETGLQSLHCNLALAIKGLQSDTCNPHSCFLVQKLYISECGMSATNKSGFEDITEVHARLFNHRPFLQGEVKHFLR